MQQRKKKDAQGRVIPRDWTKEEEEIAAGEEKLMVKEFADKLAHNLGLVRLHFQEHLNRLRTYAYCIHP